MAKPGKAPTLNDVAELAGVSRATASRALAGYGRISAATVRVVEVAAQKLGYKPNEVARAMRAGKTKTIGLVVISDFTNAFFDRATKAIIDAAKQNGYQTLVSHTDEQVDNEKSAVQTLLEKRVDGLIVVPSSDTDHEHLQPEQLGTTPLVLIDRRLEGSFTSITTGDYEGSMEAVAYAYGRGHRQMGFLVGVPGLTKNTVSWPHIPISTLLDRAHGFEAASKKLKIKSKMIFCQETQESAEKAVEDMLSAANPPTIILTSNNDMLLAVLRVAGKNGITIGKKLSVVSFDDSPWTAAMSPAITVISRPVDELGSRAVSALLEQMRGEKPAGEVVMPTLLIERDSVAKLRP